MTFQANLEAEDGKRFTQSDADAMVGTKRTLNMANGHAWSAGVLSATLSDDAKSMTLELMWDNT